VLTNLLCVNYKLRVVHLVCNNIKSSQVAFNFSMASANCYKIIEAQESIKRGGKAVAMRKS